MEKHTTIFCERIFVFICIVFFFSVVSHRAFAAIRISEIMYDASGSDTNREWVEIENPDSASVDISGYKFFESGGSHTLTSAKGGNSIAANSFAIIAQNATQFLADNTNFSGVLFDSSWSALDNTNGETIGIKDKSGNIVDQVSYTPALGANGDGNSLNKTDTTFVGALPSPGLVNNDASTVSNTETQTTNSENTTVVQVGLPQEPPSQKIEITPKITTQIISERQGIAHIPISFSVKTKGLWNEDIYSGKFVWNFGDGTEEQKLTKESFDHSFEYPGEYVVVLEYYNSPYSILPKAVDQEIVKISAPDVSISIVDTHIELSNRSDALVDISSWTISGKNSAFIFPHNTVLLSKKKISISLQAIHFTSDNSTQVALLLPDKTIVSKFPVLEISEPQENFSKSVFQNTVKTTSVTISEIPVPEIVAEVPKKVHWYSRLWNVLFPSDF